MKIRVRRVNRSNEVFHPDVEWFTDLEEAQEAVSRAVADGAHEVSLDVSEIFRQPPVGSCYSQSPRTGFACGDVRGHKGPHSWEVG